MPRDNYIRCELCGRIIGNYSPDSEDYREVDRLRNWLRFRMQHQPGCPFDTKEPALQGVINKRIKYRIEEPVRV